MCPPMASWKRRLYAMPFMAPYRRVRARQRSKRVSFAEGFSINTLDESFAGFEPVERQVMADLIRQSRGFVDVGAHHGFYSVLASHIGVPAIAVEPDEANIVILSSNIAGRDIELVDKAVSDRPGRMTFFGDGEVGSLNGDWEGAASFFRRKVDVTTLDELLTGRFEGAPLLIKVDVEGHEDKVMEGAREVIARPDVTWMIETQAISPSGKPCSAYHRLFDIMGSAGYAAHYAATGGPASEKAVGTADDASLRNIIFARRSEG